MQKIKTINIVYVNFIYIYYNDEVYVYLHTQITNLDKLLIYHKIIFNTRCGQNY